MFSTGEDNVFRFWDLQSFKTINYTPLKDTTVTNVVDMAISADSSKIFISDLDNNLIIFDVKNASLSNKVLLSTLISSSLSVEIASDASFAVSAGQDDKKIRLWSIRKNEKIVFKEVEKVQESLDKANKVLTLSSK